MLRITSCFRDALSWLLTGTVVLLVLLFSAMIVRDYGRGDRRRPAKHRRKGECADPRPESGTRVGMGMRMHHAFRRRCWRRWHGSPECCGSR